MKYEAGNLLRGCAEAAVPDAHWCMHGGVQRLGRMRCMHACTVLQGGHSHELNSTLFRSWAQVVNRGEAQEEDRVKEYVLPLTTGPSTLRQFRL